MGQQNVMSVRISIHDIRPGVTCGDDVLDDYGRLLLSGGTFLTEAYLTRMMKRGITHLSVASSDLDTLRGNSVAPFRPTAAAHGSLASRRVDRAGEPYSSERTERFAEQLNEASSLVQEIGIHAVTVSPASLSALCNVPLQIAEMLAEDSDQSLSSVDSRGSIAELSERCVQMSMLAMSTAIELELTDGDVVIAGTAGLLHDVGLFELPEQFRDPSQRLTADELNAYHTHPGRTLERLKSFREVTEEALLLMLQVHELPDGSGFPRGLQRQGFQLLTHVLSTAEIYLALVNPGVDRPGIVPHDALGLMLCQCRKGLLDPIVMRAFINQMSMYSIGTQVELDNGQQATVVRREGNAFDRPVVHLEEDPLDQFVRLTESERSIVRPLCDETQQMRLEKSDMPELALQSLISRH